MVLSLNTRGEKSEAKKFLFDLIANFFGLFVRVVCSILFVLNVDGVGFVAKQILFQSHDAGNMFHHYRKSGKSPNYLTTVLVWNFSLCVSLLRLISILSLFRSSRLKICGTREFLKRTQIFEFFGSFLFFPFFPSSCGLLTREIPQRVWRFAWFRFWHSATLVQTTTPFLSTHS
jgi:hypothetical protein